MLHYLLLAAAGTFPFVGVAFYIVSTIKGRTKPAKVSWLIWMALAGLSAAGMYQAHALNVQIVAVFLANALVVLVAFKYGSPGWTRLDKVCLIGAALGVILWALTRDPLYVIVISLAVNFVGSVPTIVKTWSRPEEESPIAWAFIASSSLAQTFALTSWSIASAAQPIIYLATQATVLLLILLRPR